MIAAFTMLTSDMLTSLLQGVSDVLCGLIHTILALAIEKVMEVWT